MSRTALFVIDIQRALADDPSTQIPHAKRVVDAGNRILRNGRGIIDKSVMRGEKASLDIVCVQHEETSEKGNLQRGSREWALVFPPRDDDWTTSMGNECLVSKDVRVYIDVVTFDGSADPSPGDTFQSNPNLAAELRERDVGTVVAFGIQSECCVLSTCRGALAAGFKVVLLKGAHSTYDTDEKTALEIEKEVEEALEAEGARILSYEEWSNVDD
ncbi:hypothetical protein E8E12_004871 [Didymella heteroderae]|uniref:Isochorismatase-like domain-containing protein n=1 Tax=Didymella heteroderae TaxID=1769908 RepID=A0A9P4WTH9_9PLEO|nr:hypothetical protein E8E12_004871 [Didymella heteroderae]